MNSNTRAVMMAAHLAQELQERAVVAAMRRLVDKDDPVLRRVADVVEHGEDVRPLVSDMLHCMVRNRGIGLAAPQVGVSKRIIIGACNQRGEDWSFCLINPVLESHDKHRVWGREGCLSLPGQTVGQRRWKKVVVTGFNTDWQPVRIKARGLLARVLQHEMDHLDGVLMTDGDVSDPKFGRPRALNPHPGPQAEFMNGAEAEAKVAAVAQSDPQKVLLPGAPQILTRRKTQVEVIAPGIGLVRRTREEKQ